MSTNLYGSNAWSSRQLVSRFRAGELSPVEVLDDVLVRAESVNGQLNVLVLLDSEAAHEAARAAERRYLAGTPLGPIDGVPVSIKDVILTARWPTRRGSHALPPAMPLGMDAPAAARLIEAGAVLFAKTTTPELGWKAVTDGPAGPPTRNPWNPALTAGGSSGGAAACVAAGLGPIALGSDGGGSVRIPASFCGVAGIKPTRGLIPVWPASTFGSLSHVGPLARDVADLAVALSVLGVEDLRDGSFPREIFPTVDPDASVGSLAGLRVGIPALFPDCYEPSVRSVFDRAVSVLTDAGVVVTEMKLHFDGLLEAFQTLWCVGLAQAVRKLPNAVKANMDSGLIAAAEKGASFSALDYQAVMTRRDDLVLDMARLFAAIDVLATPTVPVPPFQAGFDVPAGSGMSTWPEWTPFTYPFNLTGMPALSVPAGLDAVGLPVGLQLVARYGLDNFLLDTARGFEAVREPMPDPPLWS